MYHSGWNALLHIRGTRTECCQGCYHLGLEFPALSNDSANDPGFSTSSWPDGGYQVRQLPADGSYSLVGCPCGDLTA
jgi:hypothetical protein